MPAVTRKGYSFQGYYTEENGVGEAYYDQYQNGLQIYRETEDITLHAYWNDDVAPEVTLTATPANWTNDTSGVFIKGLVRDYGVGLESVILYKGNEALEKNKIEEIKLTNLDDASAYVFEYVHTTEGIQNYTLQAIDQNGNIAQARTVAHYDITAPMGNVVSKNQDDTNGILEVELFVTDYNKSELYQYTQKHLTDREVRVAVIDTGFDKSKPKEQKIAERVIDTKQNFSNSGAVNDIQDDNGHGTQLANLILGETPENVKILPIKVANVNGQSTINGTYRAIKEAINQEADVILLSMNGPKGEDRLLRQAIKTATEQGISVVVSAGNYGQNVSGYALANIPEAIVVSAIEDGMQAEYSNYGKLVDFCADGIYKIIDDQGKEITFQGTSIAAARVAAQLAEMKTFVSEPDRLEEILKYYVQDIGKPEEDIYYGKGYIGKFKIDTNRKETLRFGVENKNRKVKYNHNKSEEALLNIQFLEKTGYFKIRIDTPEGWIRYKVTTTVKNTLETEAQTMTYTVTEDKKSSSNYKQQFQINLTHIKNSKDDHGNYNMFQASLKITPKGEATTQELKGYHLEKDSEMPIYVVNGTSHCKQGNILENTVELVLGSNSLGMNNGCGCTDCHVTFRYVYTENKYQITYDTQGGTGVLPDGVVSYNENYTLPAIIPTKIGHTFQGYYLKRPNGNVWGGSANGWVKNTETEKFLLYRPSGNTTFGKNIGGPTAQGETFTYVAVWKKNQYTIAYQANGGRGTVSGEVIDYNTSHIVNNNQKFQRDGHTFQGYYLKRASDGKVLYINGSVYEWLDESKNKYTVYKMGARQNFGPKMVRTDVSLETDTFIFVALWKKNSYTVTYRADGGKIRENGTVSTTRTVSWDEHIPLNLEVIPDDSYYTFVGWGLENVNEPCSSLKMGHNGITGNITLYALYSTPVSDVEEVYLIVKDTTGKYSRNGREYEKIPLTQNESIQNPVKGYHYKLNRISYKELFPNSKLEELELGIYARDFAGNTRLLWGSEVQIPEYTQTVEHWFQNLDDGKDAYEKREIVIKSVLKGDTYTPVALSEFPVGYLVNEEKSRELNKTYTVTGEKTTVIYYDAIAYTLTLNANKGQLEGKNIGENTLKTVYNGKPYGYLPGTMNKKSTVEGFPTVTRKGYRFLGWFTNATLGEGIAIDENTRYSLTTDSTIYAQWEKKEYAVTYNYWANGGTKINTEQEKNIFPVKYGEPVDLNVSAVKEGWIHIGWNTQPSATEPLQEPFDMPEEAVELYAIYKKDITITYIDKKENHTDIRKETKTIYNRETEAEFCLKELNNWSDWQPEGWCIEEPAEASVYESAGKNLYISEDLTLYGKYSKEVSVSYDTNGSGQEFPTETKIRYYNASGAFENPVFVLAQAPVLEKNSFIGWRKSEDLEQEEQGSQQQTEVYAAGQNIALEEDAVFVAGWDEYPQIQAYDRYFTLEHAKQGIDTQTLLQEVKSTDKEDGELENGRDVTVLYYDSEELKCFTTDGSISITYQATDSFGNMATKLVMVHIVDTSVRNSGEQEYVRFISDTFYKENNEYIAFEKGGLEEKSVWKENSVYTELLDYALSNQKTQEVTVEQEFLGTIREVIKPGTGVWEHQEETWTFTRDQIEEVKMLISRKGYGKYRNMTGIQEFCQQFSGCRE